MLTPSDKLMVYGTYVLWAGWMLRGCPLPQLSRTQRWAAAEVSVIFTLVMIAIWFFQQQTVSFTAIISAIAGVVVVSAAIRIHSIKKRIPEDIDPAKRNALISEEIENYTWEIGIGRWRKSFLKGWRVTLDCSWVWKLAILTVLGTGLVLVAGYWLKPEFWLKKGFWGRLEETLYWYLIWGIIQQFVFHACVTSRIYSIFAKDSDPLKVETKAVWLTVLVSGLLFLFVHIPNPKLMIITPVAGAATAYIFLHCRNIWLLGVAHGILGTVITHCLPLSMRIGPHYWS
ncbi:MAG: CPBP family glutamic-type intramembrane protease [bacterium]|nr:CPBP family glutamic-type intramembrane protease [bacterium]